MRLSIFAVESLESESERSVDCSAAMTGFICFQSLAGKIARSHEEHHGEMTTREPGANTPGFFRTTCTPRGLHPTTTNFKDHDFRVPTPKWAG